MVVFMQIAVVVTVVVVKSCNMITGSTAAHASPRLVRIAAFLRIIIIIIIIIINIIRYSN
ncbi:hypothetical protein E2C01_035321 [Portunus trituberculatus]|uniref:Uncharacterized protein n=1 Tax=Portunus trituberculatus TaxID=210409 RepID=A0A5B7F2X6_PORTR|nr:hypothetical protein [Portunus trituberculatus]